MKVVIGGTFDRLHKGHEALIAKAFEIGDTVLIGVTSDAYVRKTKEDWIRIKPVWERVEGLKKFLESKGWLGRAEIVVIEGNAESPAAERPDLDAIVVSRDTVDGAKEINAARARRGLRPLAISIVPTVIVGGRTVSSTDIRKAGGSAGAEDSRVPGSGYRPAWTRGQGAFEYILLLGGVLLIVVFIGAVLRGSYSAAGGQINQIVAAAATINVITPTPTPGATPDAGCDELRPRCLDVPTAVNRSCYSHGQLCGPATADRFCWACPTATPAPCPGGYQHQKCISGYAPKYCEFGQIRDYCQSCGCPDNLTCSASGACVTPTATPVSVTPTPATPTPTVAPTARPTPVSRGPVEDTFATVGLALDSFSTSMLGIGSSITQLILSIGTFAWVIVLAGLLLIMAGLVFLLSRASKK